MTVRFAKYHGTGNDFVMIEDLEDRIDVLPELVAALCHRGTGVGADGVIRVVRAEAADFFMDYRNADGQIAEMCGNGIRCLAKLVYERGFTAATELDVATRSGVKHVSLRVSGGVVDEVTVDMGPPAFERGAIPMTGEPSERFLEERLEVAGRAFTASAVSMGNPHCVVFLESMQELGAADVRTVGPEIEHLPLFPNRANVEFVAVRDGEIHVRVWERGSGETLACGTGACAALVASALAGRSGREADLFFPGGRLHLVWGPDDHVLMTGPAVRVFEADLDDGWRARADAGGA
jgi:diaminopimelate epimerase